MKVHSIETGAWAMRGTRYALGCCKGKPRFAGLLNASREGDGGDTHFLRERERREVDDELFGLANIRTGVLGLGRPRAADANADGRGIVAEHIEEGKRGGIDRAASITGRHPGDRARQDGREQQFVALRRQHRLEIELHLRAPHGYSRRLLTHGNQYS
jgi:hypothetical protein